MLTSAPALTLALPELKEPGVDLMAMMKNGLDTKEAQQQQLGQKLVTTDSSTQAPPVQHLGMVVGGTGIAPAVQILREVMNVEGAFGPECKATLLYSSRTPNEVRLRIFVGTMRRLKRNTTHG